MARVIVTDLADADTAKILHDISRDAGQLVASHYIADIEALYDKSRRFSGELPSATEAWSAYQSRRGSPLHRGLSIPEG